MKKCFWDYIRVKTKVLYILSGIGLVSITIGWNLMSALTQPIQTVVCAFTTALYVSSFSALVFRLMGNYMNPSDCLVWHDSYAISQDVSMLDIKPRLEIESIVGRINEILFDFKQLSYDREISKSGFKIVNCFFFSLYVSSAVAVKSRNILNGAVVFLLSVIGMLLAYLTETASTYVIPGEIEPARFTRVTREDIEQSRVIDSVENADFWCCFWRYQKQHMQKSNIITILWHVFNVVGIALLTMLTIS